MEEPWFDRKLFENIRFCGSGGAAQHKGVAQRWEEKTGIPIYQGYGMTECGPLISYAPHEISREGSAGQLVDRMEVKISSKDPYNEVG